jgi:nuclear cap-binding protein subunit 1
MGETGNGRDIGTDLATMISKVDETKDMPVEQALEELSVKLLDQMDAYEDQIVSIISDCVAYVPQKMTVFSTLSGLLNAKNNQFGGSVSKLLVKLLSSFHFQLVSKLVADLKARFNADEYDVVIRIVTFMGDLGNSRVLTLDSIVEFLFGFIDNTAEQNASPQGTLYKYLFSASERFLHLLRYACVAMDWS